jgi:CubicO group peptidase (beta-lactamase class C family)
MRRFLTFVLLVCLSVFVAFPCPLLSLAEEAKLVELEKVAIEELRETNTPGAAVAVVSGGRVIFAKGFGLSNIETGTPLVPNMLFRIGSLTKMFTAAVLVTLSEEGKIDLHKPIGKYVKGLNPRLAQVSARQLLSHTAGITDESPLDYGSHDDSALGAYVRSLKEDHFFSEPGRIFSYSNPGFDVAGFLIEELGNRPYADQMSERLFKPLGMNSTTFRPTMAMTYPLSQGHDVSGNGKPMVLRPFGDNAAGWPDGFMFSNVNDLGQFAIAFMNGGKIHGKQVLKPSAITKLSTPYADLQSGFGFGNGEYGYGLFVHDYRGIHIVWHAGLIPGFGGLLEMVPSENFGVIILANKSGSLLNKSAEKAMELFVGLKPKAERKPIQELKISQGEMMNCVGTYVNKPESARILVGDGKLFLKQEDDEFLITKVGNYRYSITKPGQSAEDFMLIPGAGGQIEYLHIERHALKRIQN